MCLACCNFKRFWCEAFGFEEDSRNVPLCAKGVACSHIVEKLSQSGSGVKEQVHFLAAGKESLLI